MQKLLFISRVAFICNICFFITYLVQYIPVVSDTLVLSTIVVLGTVVSIVMNVFANSLYALGAMARWPVRQHIPLWLLAANLISFLIQVILLIR